MTLRTTKKIILLSVCVAALLITCLCFGVTKAQGSQSFTKINKSIINEDNIGTDTLSFTVNTHGKTLTSYFSGEPLEDGASFNFEKSSYTYALDTDFTDPADGIYFGIHAFQGTASAGWYDLWLQYDTSGGYFSGVFLNGRAMPFNTPIDCPEGMNDVDLFFTATPCPMPDTVIETSFDPNGGVWANNASNAPAKINEVYFTETVLPETPTKGNKTLLGWFDAEGNEIGLDFVRFWDPNFVAKWGVTISYDANGGTGEIEDQSCVENDKLTLSDGSQFTKEDVTLLGWNTKPDGSGDNYALGEEITGTDSLTLYAQWSEAPQPEPTPDPDPTPTPGEQVNATTQTGDSNVVIPLAILAATCSVALIARRKFN